MSNEPSPTRQTPAFLTVTAIALVFVVALARGLGSVEEPDTWWHIRVGEYLLDTRRLVWPDPWAPFTDKPYVATQWLPEAIAAQLYRWFGLGGVLWLRAVAVVALTLVVYAACRRFGGRLAAALGAGVAIVGASASLNPRPQLVSFVLFAVVVGAWIDTARDRRARWWLVPLFWLWACSHGLWMFGVLVGVVTTVGLLPEAVRAGELRPFLRRFAALHLACVLALLVTPLGPRLILAPFTVAANAAGIAEEWAPTPVNNAFSFITMTAIVGIATCWLLRPRRRPMWMYLWLALSAGLTLYMWRLVPLGVILVAPLLTDALQELVTGARERVSRPERRALVGATVAALLIAAGVCATPHGRTAFGYPDRMGAISAALDQTPAGSVVMPDFGVSGWLIYAHPELAPAADLRMESYSPIYFQRYLDAGNAQPGWQDFVRDVRARYALVERTSALADALVREARWQLVATSPQFVLLRAPAAGS
ncbi:hypothetical protein [Knoellia koreensis]|uniref:Glycosyltransferase RgtA/B/C/D-like domain-containing protein n=1 Tax=Knoellia koreensis TaxID=2730921 RepID=A0A849HJ41_9MICO|nr:hypothetical protein [Knoellia sp. DB2414S]NNM46341.1 hypothetical protein [Knoellia sp. DB2414S]